MKTFGLARKALLNLILLSIASLSRAEVIDPAQVIARASGAGSIPGALLRDGTVCITQTKNGLECRKLTRLSDDVVGKFHDDYASFDGIFDLDNDGAPQIFIDYWSEPDKTDLVKLLVFKKAGGGYEQYMSVSAPTFGYAPMAWFINEAPTRKMVLQPRCGGSSGECLYYLDFQKRALKPIDDDIFIEQGVTIKDIDGDGTAEIFVKARGRDRTAAQGAALYHWRNDNYKLWWPTGSSGKYIVYAEIADLDGDGKNEIVAVVDPKGDSRLRELSVWKLSEGAWRLVGTAKLPEVEEADPRPLLARIGTGAHGASIDLDYGEDYKPLVCRYRARKLSCGSLHPVAGG